MTGAMRIDAASHPRRGFHVRRRRVGDRVFLLFGTAIHPLDGLALAVWDLCDGRTAVGEIVLRCAALNPALDVAAVAQRVVEVLSGFEAHGLTWRDFTGAGAPPAPAPAWGAVLQLFHEHADRDWREGVPQEEQARIVARFVRILYEFDASARGHALEPADEQAFRERMLACARERPADFAAAVRDLCALRYWKYRRDEYKIVIVTERSVYSGDLDHRR
ncbi:hypothetical protein [Arenibaculum sp.]|uniref:PqqD family protein n=1 Tax=Arenibaculum sp. TaxID=2865862 RepID=UPI002E16212A|nr:hypothetical protein [Arenibaculum sp.]